jgi:hypothetical protein
MPKGIRSALKRRVFHSINFNRAVIIISAIVVVAPLSWSAKAWLVSSANASPVAHPPQTSMPGQGIQEKAAPSSIQVEPVTLKPSGFEPNEIRRPASPFVLAVNNRSRLLDVSFKLLREDGHKLHEMKGPKGQVNQRKLLDLPPGNYLLKEVNHPEWTCRIVLSR